MAAPKRKRKVSARQRAIINGYRSGLEETIGAQLKQAGTPYLYEGVRLPFIQPAKRRTYTPDFLLPNGIIIETKGQFTSGDRQKHLYIQEQLPDLDLRFVFSRSKSRISKQSKTTYAVWCDSKGFQYADLKIPQAWLREPVNRRSIDTLIGALGDKAAAEVLAFYNII